MELGLTRLRFLPFLLLIVPLTEIALFVLIGGMIGVLPTIGIVLATAVTGAWLLRSQGLRQLDRIRTQMAAGAMPGRDIADGAMMLVAGVLLLTPGFFTDSLGFLLFVPAIRAQVFRFLAARVHAVQTPFAQASFGHGPDGNPGHGKVVDLDPEDWRG